jgi:hypothetical protein
MFIQQTAANLWQELKDALALPQTANLTRLGELLDWAIAQVPEDQQLEVAGQAIEQMAEIYKLRFDVLMRNWEDTDPFLESEETLPVLDLEALETWIRQSMSVDLDALVEQPTSTRNRQRQTLDPTDSVVALVAPEAILQMVEDIEAEEYSQMIRQLAGEEEPAKWSAAIASWIRTHSNGNPVRLMDLYLELGMPLVEIWIGLLLSGELELEQRRQFYELSGIWVRSKPRSSY